MREMKSGENNTGEDPGREVPKKIDLPLGEIDPAEEDEAYAARREARMERIRQRKRRQKRKRIAIGTLTVAAAAVFCAAVFFGDDLKAKLGTEGKVEQSVREDKNNEDKAGEAAAKAEAAGAEAPEEKQEAKEEKHEIPGDERKILGRAKRYATQYDYDKAIKLLKESEFYDKSGDMQKAASNYEKKKASCVSWPLEEVTHIFYHSLIVDTARTFDGDNKAADYNQVMTTVDEFNKITQTMYDKGYVMVSMKDMAIADENGNITRGEILLPPGKIPFVLSQDDVCYYHYMDGDGYASKLVVDGEGKIRNEYIDGEGNVLTGDYDMVPLIDRFVEEHPDFSYRGAKGVLALTGYNGILGYRTDISYQTRPDDLDWNKVEWLDNHPEFDLEKERAAAKEVADAMKKEGWEFASHTWGHQDIQQVSMERLQRDTAKFKENVDPLIGGTDTIIFAFGTDLTMSEDYYGEKFDFLKGQGYNYYCNVDSQKYFVQIRDNYFRMGRRNLDGYRMYYNPELLEDLFVASEVFDPARPQPVPPMG